jgi:hypothetical protein
MRGKTLAQRWRQVRSELSLPDLLMDVTGKILVAFSVGLLLGLTGSGHPAALQTLPSAAAFCMVIGVILIAIVKKRYWRRFWA